MQKNNEKALESLEFQGYRRLAGMGFEPHDLRVMSPTSYQAALPRDIQIGRRCHPFCTNGWCRWPVSNRYDTFVSRDFKSRASANSATPATYISVRAYYYITNYSPCQPLIIKFFWKSNLFFDRKTVCYAIVIFSPIDSIFFMERRLFTKQTVVWCRKRYLLVVRRQKIKIQFTFLWYTVIVVCKSATEWPKFCVVFPVGMYYAR